MGKFPLLKKNLGDNEFSFVVHDDNLIADVDKWNRDGYPRDKYPLYYEYDRFPYTYYGSYPHQMEEPVFPEVNKLFASLGFTLKNTSRQWNGSLLSSTINSMLAPKPLSPISNKTDCLLANCLTFMPKNCCRILSRCTVATALIVNAAATGRMWNAT